MLEKESLSKKEELQVLKAAAKHFAIPVAIKQDVALRAVSKQQISACIAPVTILKVTEPVLQKAFPNTDFYLIEWLGYKWNSEKQIVQESSFSEVVAWFDARIYRLLQINDLRAVTHSVASHPLIAQAFAWLTVYPIVQEKIELTLWKSEPEYEYVLESYILEGQLLALNITLRWRFLFKKDVLALVTRFNVPFSVSDKLPPNSLLAAKKYELLTVPEDAAKEFIRLERMRCSKEHPAAFRNSLAECKDTVDNNNTLVCITPIKSQQVIRPEWIELFPLASWQAVTFTVLIKDYNGNYNNYDFLRIYAEYKNHYYDARTFVSLLDANQIVITDQNMLLIAKTLALMTIFDRSPENLLHSLRFTDWRQSKESIYTLKAEAQLYEPSSRYEESVEYKWDFIFKGRRLISIKKFSPSYSNPHPRRDPYRDFHFRGEQKINHRFL